MLVVADAHLGQVPPAVAAAFHRFLDAVPDLGDALLINGDLLDFWFEYRAVIPRRHFGTMAKLQSLRARGVPVTFVGGNHDRWGGDFFTKDLGIAFHAGEAEIDVAGRRSFVAHGDGLTEQQWSARLLHRVTRHAATELIARQYLEPLQRAGVDVLVLGCTHYPLLKPLLARVLGAGVTLVDSAEETAKVVAQALEQGSLSTAPDAAAVHRFVVSDDEPHFRKVGARFLGEKLQIVEVVPLG